MPSSPPAQPFESPIPPETTIGESARRGVHYRIDEGCLTLFGTASSFYEKQLIQERAKRLTGVKRVVNLVEVIPRQDDPAELP